MIFRQTETTIEPCNCGFHYNGFYDLSRQKTKTNYTAIYQVSHGFLLYLDLNGAWKLSFHYDKIGLKEVTKTDLTIQGLPL